MKKFLIGLLTVAITVTVAGLLWNQYSDYWTSQGIPPEVGFETNFMIIYSTAIAFICTLAGGFIIYGLYSAIKRLFFFNPLYD